MPKILYATVLLACVVISRPVQAQQSLVLNVGHFAVRGIDTRVADDVLLENLNLFAFDISDFNNGTVGAEWLVGLGDHFDVGVGLGFYQRTVLSVYNDFIDFDGTEIEQDFRLRVVPVTATVRVLPFGRTAVQPYFGVGLGLFNWRYSEVGSLSTSIPSTSFATDTSRRETTLGRSSLGASGSRSGTSFQSEASSNINRPPAQSGSTRGFSTSGSTSAVSRHSSQLGSRFRVKEEEEALFLLLRPA